MDFSAKGQATSRSYQRNLPCNSRQYGKTQINPITGEEMCIQTPRMEKKPEDVKSGNENNNGIPSLNLSYLKDEEDAKTGAIDIDLNDYSLDTPNSASTVSWGTARSSEIHRVAGTKPQISTKSTRAAIRPDDVPILELTKTNLLSARKEMKQPSAWDKEAVPDNLPPPSARYKQLYQQYSEDMKKSYREHVNSARFNKLSKDQNNLEKTVDKLHNGQQCLQQQEEIIQKMEEEVLQPEQDPHKWTQQTQPMKQLLRRKDAEDLLEKNKRLKMIETVMIDQLSRAVISDPEQNECYNKKQTSSRLGRGSNRHLHDSKISTSATATENLLSKRIRFGARILTRDGHDAMRELTGFFFDFDKTLTVYEFRKFGKSAKAMPFIYRGLYLHLSGPKQGSPYSLSDIYSGATIKIPTVGQLALTRSLAEKPHIILRITEVDEEERQHLMYNNGMDRRPNMTKRIEDDNRAYLHMIQDEVKQQIHKRGIRTVTGLGQFYRTLDQYNIGILDQYDLEKGLKTFHINIEPEKLEEVFDILDPDGSKLLDYGDYMHGVIGEMNEYRKSLVRKAFLKLDCNKNGVIHITDIRKFFNVNSKYKPTTGGDTSISALQAFLEVVRENERQELITYIEFEEYYEGLNVGIDKHEDFANILANTWNI